jgi:hypothetical protein
MKKKFYLKDAIIVLPWLTVAYLLRTVNILTSQVTELQEMLTRQRLSRVANFIYKSLLLF